MYFCYFVFISPLKKTGPFIWTNFVPSLEIAAASGSGQGENNVKSLQQRRLRQQQQRTKPHFSLGSGEPKKIGDLSFSFAFVVSNLWFTLRILRFRS